MTDFNLHPTIRPGNSAVITGGASGIGLAAARFFAAAGMNICVADVDRQALTRAAAELAAISPGGADKVCAMEVDVTAVSDIDRLAEAAFHLGPVSVLMNNAAAFRGGDPLSNPDDWRRLIDVNILGVLNGIQRIGNAMIDQKKPGVIINTGSKQGITSPPGDFAYNMTKSAVKTLTEGLAHTLRNRPDCQVSAHLLIPGFTYTGAMAKYFPTQPPAAWSGEQVIARMIAGLARGDFYILCEDNETTRAQDERRILWAAGDIIEGRPALSRWHPEFKEAFQQFMDST